MIHRQIDDEVTATARDPLDDYWDRQEELAACRKLARRSVQAHVPRALRHHVPRMLKQHRRGLYVR